MTNKDLQTLLDFNYWARDRVLEAVRTLDAQQYTRDLGNSFPSIRDTLVHIYSAEWVWYSRWQGTSPTSRLTVDQFPDLDTLEPAWKSLETDIRAFVAGLGDEGLARDVDYKLLSGQPGRSAYWQMVQHMVNHGSYHRGQITTMLRQIGAKPPQSTDLITFYRR
jgi:uncharacterized damage-inducible protein DinB